MTPDGDDIASRDDLELALTAALQDRVGATIDAPAPEVAGGERLAAIEGAVGAGGRRRRTIPILAATAAAVVLVVGTVAVARSSDDSEVHSIADEPVTTSTAGPPGTEPDAPGGDELPPEPTSTTSSVPTSSIGLIDFRNFTYPTSACGWQLRVDNGPMSADSFTLVDGNASLDVVVPDGRLVPDLHLMELVDVRYGDATGDGVDDAIVSMNCGLAQSDGVWMSVSVVTEQGGVPTVIGSIDRSGAPVVEPAHVEFILDVSTADGHLVIRWNQTESQFGWDQGQQKRFTVTYQWDGSTLVPTTVTDIEVIPPKELPPAPPPVPLTDADYANLVLPTDRTLSGTTRAVCRPTFIDDDPVDTTVVDGHGVVHNRDGQEIGAVDFDHVEFANLDGDDLAEALVWIRCTRGDTTTMTVSVYEAGPERPYLLWSTPGWDRTWEVVDLVQVRPGQDCVLLIRYHDLGHPYDEAHLDYRRTEHTFEQVPPGTCAT